MKTFVRLLTYVTLVAATFTAPGRAQAPAPAPAPAAIAAATELLQVLGMEAQFDAILPMLMTQMKQVVTASNPAAGKEMDTIIPRLQHKFSTRKGDVIPMAAQVYARRLSVDDMKAMTAFFKSSSGQRFVAMQPVLTQESMQLGQEWGRRLGADVEREIREELQKRGIKL